MWAISKVVQVLNKSLSPPQYRSSCAGVGAAGYINQKNRAGHVPGVTRDKVERLRFSNF